MPRPAPPTRRVRLRPADPFDLIRLIARSQADPRKAVAELVQNSLDAGASLVRITWFTHAGRRALSVWDDGRGVFPDLTREEALHRIATTIGASHKAQLSASERHRQMTLGKYGIGLLGFWSVGKTMEIRSRVAGSEVRTLLLQEDRRDAEVARPRAARLPIEETFTEVVVGAVHPAAEPQLKPRRLAAYLAGELRGQLLQREVRLEVLDRVGRGRAPKRLVVRPQRYRGVAVDGPAELPVPGQAAARVELYLVPEGEERHGRVALACGGTTVLDDLAFVEGADRSREPWSLGRFEGVVDFPDLEVAPGSRRGFVPNEAARAFLEALPALEARCREVLAEESRRRQVEREAHDARDLRRLFRNLPRLLPQYALFDVREGRAPGPAEAGPGEPVEEPTEAALPAPVEPEPSGGFLFAPGPLAAVDLRPRRSVLPIEGERRFRAVARDADGREVTEGIRFAWSLDGPGTLHELPADRGAAALYRAPEAPGTSRVIVAAVQGATRAEGLAEIRVREAAEPENGGGSGVPDPEPVLAPAEPWRSRVLAGRWEYNKGHPDYRSVQDDPRRRLRYLAHLFAKEVVVRNFGDPGAGALLERMVEVLTHIGEVLPRRGAREAAVSGEDPAGPEDREGGSTG